MLSPVHLETASDKCTVIIVDIEVLLDVQVGNDLLPCGFEVDCLDIAESHGKNQ